MARTNDLLEWKEAFDAVSRLAAAADHLSLPKPPQHPQPPPRQQHQQQVPGAVAQGQLLVPPASEFSVTRPDELEEAVAELGHAADTLWRQEAALECAAAPAAVSEGPSSGFVAIAVLAIWGCTAAALAAAGAALLYLIK